MKKFIFLTFALCIFFSCNVCASAIYYEDDRIPSFDTNPDGFFGFDPDDGKKLRSQSVADEISDTSELDISESDLLTMRLSGALYTRTYEKFSALLSKSKLSSKEIEDVINSLPNQSRSFVDKKMRLEGWLIRYQEGLVDQKKIVMQ